MPGELCIVSSVGSLLQLALLSIAQLRLDPGIDAVQG